MKHPFRQLIEDLCLVTIAIVGFAAIASNEPTLYQTISPGTLDVDMVDGGNVTVPNPSVNFSTRTFSFSGQQSTGTLGTASEIVRVTNATATPTWTLDVSATGGNTSRWSDGGNSYGHNESAGNGRLEVDASGGTITPKSGCADTDISKGIATYFENGVAGSITLLTAGASADTGCYWDFIGIGLAQDIPAAQPAGSYQLGLTLSVY